MVDELQEKKRCSNIQKILLILQQREVDQEEIFLIIMNAELFTVTE